MRADVQWASLLALTLLSCSTVADACNALSCMQPALQPQPSPETVRTGGAAPSVFRSESARSPPSHLPQVDGSWANNYDRAELCQKLVADITATEKLDWLLSKKLSLQQSKRSAQKPLEPETSGLSPNCANASESLIHSLAIRDELERKRNDDLSHAIAAYKPAGTQTDAGK